REGEEAGRAARQGFSARARALSGRLRPRARQRADHRAGGARSRAIEEARCGGGTRAARAVGQCAARVRRTSSPQSIAYNFTPGTWPMSAIMLPPISAPMIPKMIETMITAGIAAKVHLIKITTMRQNGI